MVWFSSVWLFVFFSNSSRSLRIPSIWDYTIPFNCTAFGQLIYNSHKSMGHPVWWCDELQLYQHFKEQVQKSVKSCSALLTDFHILSYDLYNLLFWQEYVCNVLLCVVLHVFCVLLLHCNVSLLWHASDYRCELAWSYNLVWCITWWHLCFRCRISIYQCSSLTL